MIDPANEIGESITITNRNQLSQITQEQAKKIKPLIIENQIFDDEMSNNVKIFDGKLEQVYFVECSFLDDGLGILREFPSVSKEGFLRCNLSYDVLQTLLYSNDPYNEIKVLDLTGNKLSKDSECFVDILESAIFPFKAIKELILVDNGFDANIISLIKRTPNCIIEKIYIEKRELN